MTNIDCCLCFDSGLKPEEFVRNCVNFIPKWTENFESAYKVSFHVDNVPVEVVAVVAMGNIRRLIGADCRIAVVGPLKCGKSTLLNTAWGFDTNPSALENTLIMKVHNFDIGTGAAAAGGSPALCAIDFPGGDDARAEKSLGRKVAVGSIC